MKLSEKFRPSRLSDIVGQPCVAQLQGFVKQPHSCCWLFEGPGGSGKTTAAFALAAELGAGSGWPGLDYVPAAELGIDAAKEMIRYLKCSFLCPHREHFHVAIIEELQKLSDQCLNYLKVGLEVELGERAIVIATSNSTKAIACRDIWFLQRFMKLEFDGGDAFAAACHSRLLEIWSTEFSGMHKPKNWMEWGWVGENGDRRFSMRTALDKFDQLRMRLASGVPDAESIPY